MTGLLSLLSAALCFCVAVCYTIEDCPADIPHDGTLRQHGDYCYIFDTHHDQTFSAAETNCELRQGHLVTIRSAETQNFLVSTLKDEFHYGGVVWVGLTDINTEGQWMWVDGHPMTYTNWDQGQPGLLGGLEDCAAIDMAHGGRWHDYQCEGFLFLTSEHRFVCEYPIVPAVTSDTTPTPPPTMTTTTPAPTTVTTTPPPTTTTPMTTTTTEMTTPQMTTIQEMTTTTPEMTTTPAHTTHPHSSHGHVNNHETTTSGAIIG